MVSSCGHPSVRWLAAALRRPGQRGLAACRRDLGAPTPRAQAPADEARHALAERDVPFEAHAFFAAAAEGDLALVDLFLEAGMPAATRDQWGSSALLEASRNDRTGVVERLLARGAKPGDAPGGEPPLAVAAEAGSLGALKALLAAGADPDQAADPARGPGGTPLQRACAAEAWESARVLLEGGARAPLSAPPLAPPLFLAAESGHAPTVALLLARGADPNVRGTGGAAPIWLPVWNGHVEVVRLLLLAGADVRADRATLLKGRPGQPVKPEIRKLLKNPPKPAAPAKKPPR
ncbi:MAG: ankyrin repeat domain-containing protein [Holophagales bacterium]|nr:ankyrin repeat domain-containing protein [Holophagales bacterium]